MTEDVRITLRLPAALRDKLAARADIEDTSMNMCIIALLEDALISSGHKRVKWPPIANWRKQ